MRFIKGSNSALRALSFQYGKADFRRLTHNTVYGKLGDCRKKVPGYFFIQTRLTYLFAEQSLYFVAHTLDYTLFLVRFLVARTPDTLFRCLNCRKTRVFIVRAFTG